MKSFRSNRPVLALVAALLVGLAAPRLGNAAAAEHLSKECVSPEAYKNLETCPGGPSQFDVKKKRSAAFKSPPPPVEKKSQTDAKPKPPSQEMSAGVRDLRESRLKFRQRTLLIAEIQGLERLFASTRKKSGDRPQLVRRLAEGYVELETAADHDMMQAEVDRDNAKLKKQRAVYDKAVREAAKHKQTTKVARQNAIKYYTIMKKDYPTNSKIDEVLYYLAYEYERDGDLDNARKAYNELVQTAPNSKYVPNAYLAFGELFFQEAMADPEKWTLAGEFYKKVMQYPAPENKVNGYAQYKLAYVNWNKGELAAAIQGFKSVIEYGDTFPKLPGATQLQKSARRDLIPVYAAAGKPDKAYGFFRPLSGDKGGGDSKTLDMLNELGLAYIDTGHYPEAIALYHDLMNRDKGDRYCQYQSYITQAVQASQSSNKKAIVTELDNQIAVRKEFTSGKHDTKAKLKCSNNTAELLAETGMSWHLEAVGSGGVRGTGSKETMDLAAVVYKKVVENFTSKDFDQFAFPRIVKEDWPNLYKIKYAMADLLYFQQRWEDCGPAFDAVVEENPTSAEAPEAAYAAVLCYQKMYDQTHKKEEARKGMGMGPKGADKKDREAKKGEWEKFKPKELSPMQRGMLSAFNRYVCYIKPPKGDKEAEEQYVDVKFARARTYFEAQHWEEAAVAFRDIAITHADKDAAVYASQLYLEAINILGSRAEPPRPSCFDDMAGDVPVFIASFCGAKMTDENKENCTLLTRIQCDVRRLKAEKTVDLADNMADKGQDGALEKYKDGGDAYMVLWKEYGEKQIGGGEEAQCGKMDEILYNAARAYQAGRLLATAMGVRRILLNPQFKLDQSELAMKAIYEMGGNYQAIAVYDQAAKYYELYAEKTKFKGEFADRAVSDAVVLRLGLGQDEEAIDDAKNFNRYYGAKKPEQTAQIAFAVAAHYEQKKDWKNVDQKLAQAMRLIDKNATPDVQIQAHALAGKALVEQNSAPGAQREYAKVVGLWKDPGEAVKRIEAGGPGAERRIGKAIVAVGEALFYFAEAEKAKKVDKLGFPVYKGKKDKEGISKHIGTKVKEWYEKKAKLIKEVSLEYKKIIDLQPVPPPPWVIAAGSRVGEMWGTFVKDFRSAPIPKEWEKDYEIRTAYYGALDDASEPYKQAARGAYDTCLKYSVDYQYFDEFSRACEVWLAGNYKSDYHLVDEFHGAPNHLNSALKERSYPLQISGEPHILASEEKAEKPAKRATDQAADKKK